MSVKTSNRWTAAIAVTVMVGSGAVFGAFGSEGGEAPTLIDPTDRVAEATAFR